MKLATITVGTGGFQHENLKPKEILLDELGASGIFFDVRGQCREHCFSRRRERMRKRHDALSKRFKIISPHLPNWRRWSGARARWSRLAKRRGCGTAWSAEDQSKNLREMQNGTTPFCFRKPRRRILVSVRPEMTGHSKTLPRSDLGRNRQSYRGKSFRRTAKGARRGVGFGTQESAYRSFLKLVVRAGSLQVIL